MKLARKDLVKVCNASPLQLFARGITAEATRRKYTATLRRIMCEIIEDGVLSGDSEERSRQFVRTCKDDPEEEITILNTLLDILRERTELPKDDENYLNPASIKTYFKPLKKLLDMNDVPMPWKCIYAAFPEQDNLSARKGWTREEMAAMLRQERAPMDRAVVLMLANSGVRLGGLDLTWGDLTPIYSADGRLTEDPGEDGEIACVTLRVSRLPGEMPTFVTPEAYRAIQEYGHMWVDMMKCQPRPEDPIFLATNLLLRR